MKTLLDDINIPFTFRQRPTPLAADLRPAWRISLVLLILFYSRGKKATLQKLHVINSACHSIDSRQTFIRYVNGEAKKDEVIPRVEPGLNRALSLARGEGLVEIEKGKNIKLTATGQQLASELNSMDCLEDEKTFLIAIRTFVSEARIEELFNWSIAL